MDIVDLSLAALATQIELNHLDASADGDRKLPSLWLAPLLSDHIHFLRDALATYRDARRSEHDDRLF